MKSIQEKLLAAQSRQKEYANRKVRDLEFMEGEQVLLKVSPMKGVMRFGKRGKLSPRYIGPFEVMKRVGEVAYELALPPGLSGVHPVFHVSMLKKTIGMETTLFVGIQFFLMRICLMRRSLLLFLMERSAS